MAAVLIFCYVMQPPTQVYVVTETVRDMSPQPLENAKVRGLYFGYNNC